MWYRWMILAFITNGLSQFGIPVLANMGLVSTHNHLYLAIWYLAGLIGAMIVVFATRTKIVAREVLLGGMMGLFSASFWFLLTAAVGAGFPGSLAAPVATGASLSVVALVGVLVLKEHLSGYGYAGVACGIAGLVILSTV